MAKIVKKPTIKKSLPILPNLNTVVDNDISNVFVSSDFSTLSDIFVNSNSETIILQEPEDISSVFKFENVDNLETNIIETNIIETNIIETNIIETNIIETNLENDIEPEIQSDVIIISDDYHTTEEDTDYTTEQILVEDFTKENMVNDIVIVKDEEDIVKDIILSEPEIFCFNKEIYFTGTHTLHQIENSNLKSFLVYVHCRNPKFTERYFTQPFHITHNNEMLVNYYTNVDTVWFDENLLTYKDAIYDMKKIEITKFDLN